MKDRIIENLLIKATNLFLIFIFILVVLSLFNSGSSNNGSKLVLMRISGTITVSGDSFVSSDKFQRWLETLEKVEKSTSIKGIVIRIDSPGGTPAASQELYNAILRIKKSGKKVIISMGDICASGGYYVASAGDEIFADPSTLTGSIGVIMSYPVISKIEKKLGLKMITIKSDKFKDIGSIHREPTDEERKILKELLLETYDQFISDVAKERKMTTSEVKLLATGELYTGLKAKKIGLVDKIGGLREAVDEIKKITNLDKNEKIVKIDEENGFLGSLFKISSEAINYFLNSSSSVKLRL